MKRISRRGALSGLAPWVEKLQQVLNLMRGPVGPLAAYPQVKGAAIWYLGDTPGTIEDQTAELIDPVRNYSLSHYFGVDPGFGRVDADIFRPSP